MAFFKGREYSKIVNGFVDLDLFEDSGMQTHNAKELAKELTELPLKLFNTHTDVDHVGSNEEFDEVMMNLSELVNYKLPHPSQRIVPRLIEGALKVEKGEITPTEADMFGQTMHVYDVGVASFLCE